MKEIGKTLLIYDEYEILNANETLDEDALNEELDCEWEYFTERLGVLFNKKFKTQCAKVIVKNASWKHDNGIFYICIDEVSNADTGLALIKSLISDREAVDYISVSNYKSGKGIALNIPSHDCPIGRDFYLLPCAESTWERNS